VYKSRIFLGAVASASIFAMGVAGPAMASTSRVASPGPRSVLTSMTAPSTALTGVSPLFGGLTGFPFLGGLGNLGGGLTSINNESSGQVANAPLGIVTGALESSKTESSTGALSASSIPGLNSASGTLGSAAGAVSGLNSVTGETSAVNNAVSSLTDLPGLTSSVPGLSEVPGLGDLTGGLTSVGR
jgi:hypothetical protein